MTLLQSNLEYSIQFDNGNMENIQNTQKDLKFGVLNIKINKTEPVTKKKTHCFYNRLFWINE